MSLAILGSATVPLPTAEPAVTSSVQLNSSVRQTVSTPTDVVTVSNVAVAPHSRSKPIRASVLFSAVPIATPLGLKLDLPGRGKGKARSVMAEIDDAE